MNEAARQDRYRLTPGRALKDLADARDFVRELGVVVRTPHAYLPSLFAAAQGEGAVPGKGGFADWPEHAWWWGSELDRDGDILATQIIEGRTTYLAQSAWPAAAAAVRGRGAALTDKLQLELLDVLRERGPSRSDQLRALLGCAGPEGKKAFDRARRAVSWLGLVLARSDVVDEHRHVAVLELWETRFPAPLTSEPGLGPFLKLLISIAGHVPEREVQRWLAWPREEMRAAVDALIEAGAVSRDSSGALRGTGSGSHREQVG